MILSDLSIRRPVICIVLSLLIVTVGLLSFRSLPVREYPDIDAPGWWRLRSPIRSRSSSAPSMACA
jgi:hypothetical protein